ncbi:uncharacterized protein LOC123870943 isoform X3 [Maniola jurtina]|uniref:uncharacterized protein LOC123870943 isoform X3 n=1 Tax=Maniola jurtina TaxID=191418 RepID=UPI001E68ABBF|nr:uncharacterized protein LOC123870943 isoform X3 [Maniola jurtina]
MDKTQENKKCFCTRCFFPIESEDRVDIDGQNFHRICSMCYTEPETSSGEHSKRFICARCLQPVDDIHRITIGDQSFHAQCGQCYFCHKVPSTNLKIYYGQVFCEECFHRHVLSRNKDNPSEFFKNCFEQWQNSPQFADNMRDFMGGNRESTPFIFMMQGQQPPFCRCGTGPQGLFQNNEPRPNEARKSATPHTISFGEDSQSCDLSFENRTEVSIPESNEESAKQENLNVTAAEKIEKLTKYLHERVALEKFDKKWKFLDFESSMEESVCGWIDLHDQALSRDCPKCLWQCGPIYVNSKFYVQNQVV